MKSTKADREKVKYLDGLYVGMLEPDEIESLNRCVADHVAIRDYDHIGGSLGLSKVKIINLEAV